ncbi:MAG: GxxExxY protein [Planctomycetes bacterium]|nr:GxxExxY protein [Planctomycetota bacterium]
MSELLYADQTYAILGACFNVYKDKGCGFHEPLYQECLEIEFEYQAIPADPQREIKLTCRGRTLKQTFRPDFLCFDRIVVELKAVSRLIDEHRAQVLNYLHATGLQVGLLVNFGHYPKLNNSPRFRLDIRKS